MHEAKMHPENMFVTLTYDEESVPADFSVRVSELQKFNKALRKKISPLKFRFFACGEYGDTTNRPHYHSLIFNYRARDLRVWAKNNQSDYIYRSEFLENIWKNGAVFVGDVTAKSAGYVARYNLKKINGDRADDHYTRRSPVDGNVYRVNPEFLIMSRRPGIGATWFSKFSSDAFPSDYLVVDGQRRPVPRYYTQKLAEGEAVPSNARQHHREVTQLNIKRRRKAASLKHRENQTPARLAVREEIQELRAKRLKRTQQ